MRPRYVLVTLMTEDWGFVDPATYVRLTLPTTFMGTIETVEVDCDGSRCSDSAPGQDVAS